MSTLFPAGGVYKKKKKKFRAADTYDTAIVSFFSIDDRPNITHTLSTTSTRYADASPRPVSVVLAFKGVHQQRYQNAFFPYAVRTTFFMRRVEQEFNVEDLLFQPI